MIRSYKDLLLKEVELKLLLQNAKQSLNSYGDRRDPDGCDYTENLINIYANQLSLLKWVLNEN